MRGRAIGAMLLLAAAVVFVLTTGTHAAPNSAKSTPVTTSQPTTTAPASVPERHPQIREAIASLRRAKEHMEHAAHDFGGHRVEALKATDEAIRQLEICLKFDKD